MRLTAPQSSSSIITRRRFLQVLAAASTAIPFSTSLARIGGAKQRFSWQGEVLGGNASMELLLDDVASGEQIVRRCTSEIARLEQMFSLHRADSLLRRLNHSGRLENPPPEFIELLTQALRLSEQTEGAFDVTIQPLWMYLYYTAPEALDPQRLAELKNLTDYRQVHLTRQRIQLARPGMQLTLNGIAQGYITDRITALLKDLGLSQVLVQLGETFGLGVNQAGRPWHIGIPHPDLASFLTTVELENRAVATSSVRGTVVESNPAFCHLLNPHLDRFSTGSANKAGRNCDSKYASVSVIANTATLADGLSTSVSLVDPATHLKLLSYYPEAQLILLSENGELSRI